MDAWSVFGAVVVIALIRPVIWLVSLSVSLWLGRKWMSDETGKIWFGHYWKSPVGKKAQKPQIYGSGHQGDGGSP